MQRGNHLARQIIRRFLREPSLYFVSVSSKQRLLFVSRSIVDHHHNSLYYYYSTILLREGGGLGYTILL